MLPFYVVALFGLSALLLIPSDDNLDTDTPDPEQPDEVEIVPVDSVMGEETLGESEMGGEAEVDTDTEETDPAETDAGQNAITDGDDVISVGPGPSIIRAGDGNDTIVGSAQSTDHGEFYGENGDDTLDGRVMDNVGLFGGEGNDILLTSNHAPSGTGYWVEAFGGDGDDRLIHEAPPQVWDANLPELTGGAGNDSFEISFDESYPVFTDSLGQEYIAWETIPVRSNLAIVTDFDPTEDSIQIDLNIDDPSYSVSSAALEVGPASRYYSDTEASDAPLATSETGNETRLIVTYESDTGPTRELVVIIKSEEVTWDDITFVGDNIPSVLQPSP